MSDDRQPKIWIDHYDLNIGVEGGPEDTLNDVHSIFQEELRKAVERDPKIGEEPSTKGVQ